MIVNTVIVYGDSEVIMISLVSGGTADYNGQQQTLTTVVTHIVVDKSTDNSKPHSICFIPQYQRQRKCFLQSVTY